MEEEDKVIEEVKETTKTKEKKRNKLLTTIKHCPKIVKKIIALLVLVLIFILGVKYSYVFTSKADSLSIEFKNVGELVTQSAFVGVL